MREDRNVPVFCQLRRRTGVIEMSMRQINRFRPCAAAEAPFGRLDNLRGPPRQTGIDKGPGTAVMPNE